MNFESNKTKQYARKTKTHKGPNSMLKQRMKESKYTLGSKSNAYISKSSFDYKQL